MVSLYMMGVSFWTSWFSFKADTQLCRIEDSVAATPEALGDDPLELSSGCVIESVWTSDSDGVRNWDFGYLPPSPCSGRGQRGKVLKTIQRRLDHRSLAKD